MFLKKNVEVNFVNRDIAPVVIGSHHWELLKCLYNKFTICFILRLNPAYPIENVSYFYSFVILFANQKNDQLKILFEGRFTKKTLFLKSPTEWPTEKSPNSCPRMPTRFHTFCIRDPSEFPITIINIIIARCFPPWLRNFATVSLRNEFQFGLFFAPSPPDSVQLNWRGQPPLINCPRSALAWTRISLHNNPLRSGHNWSIFQRLISH